MKLQYQVRIPVLLIACLLGSGIGALGCAGAPPNRGRAVTFGVEDEVTPSGARAPLSCFVAESVELEGPATGASPGLSSSTGELAVAWVVRSDGQRSIRTQQLTPRLRPQGPPRDITLEGQMPLSIKLGHCGERLLVAWQQEADPGSSIQFTTLSNGASVPAAQPLLV